MKILSLNLRHGGGIRLPGILDYLAAQRPDIFVATEYRDGKTGTALRVGLEGQGFCSYANGHVESHLTNSVLIAAKLPGSVIQLTTDKADQQRIACLDLGDLKIVGVYFAIQRDKQSLFNYLLDLPFLHDSSPCLITGDFNTGAHYLDEPGATFYCADQFEQLTLNGWTDLWRAQHGLRAREFSWYSHTGNGFRLDHALANPSANKSILSCRYDHSTRPALSDHSAIVTEVRL